MTDANRGGPLKFRLVADQKHTSGIVDDGARNIDLARIVVEQRSIVVESGSPDDRHIDLELSDQVDRRTADDRPVGASHRTAGHDDFDGWMAIKRHGDIEVVGDDEKVLVVCQRGGDFFGGRPNIDKQRAFVRNKRRSRNADFTFLRGRDEAPRLVRQVLNGRGDNGSAVGPRQDATVAKVVEITPYRLRGDLEARGEFFNRNPADRPS